jgi:hypothetical protein
VYACIWKLDADIATIICYRVVGGMGALLAVPAARAGGWAAGVRAPTATDGGITTSHALLGACGGSSMQLSGLQVDVWVSMGR